jgi:hypothetical protein
VPIVRCALSALLLSSCTGYIEQPLQDEGSGASGPTGLGGASTTAGSGPGAGAGGAPLTGGTTSGGGTSGLGGAGGSAGSVSVAPLWTGAMGSWCGPADDPTLWVVASLAPSTCPTQSTQIYGESVSDGLIIEVPSASVTTVPATLTVPGRYCTAGACNTVDVALAIDSYTAGTGASGSWSLTAPGGALVEGGLQASWCAWDDYLPAHPEGSRLARDLSLAEVAVYQGVKVPIMTNLQEVGERNADLVQSREALVRVFVTPGPAFASREIAARITLETAGSEPLVIEETMLVDGASSESDLGSTFNLMLPKDALQGDTEYSVELRETSKCTQLAGEPSGARFPDAGTLPVDARATGPIKVLLVPVRYDTDGSGRLPDTSEGALAELHDRLYAMYPTSGVELSLHTPVGTNYSDLGDMLDQMRALRDAEKPDSDLSYYGLVDPAGSFNDYCDGSCTTGIAGYGSQGGSATAGMGIGFLHYAAGTFAHEVGHIHRLPHAPCGGPASPDPNYPYAGAGIGSRGYDLLNDEFFDADEYVDLMSYCSPDWISDYNYQLLLERLILVNETAGNLKVMALGDAAAPSEWRSLRVDGNGAARWGLTLTPDGAPPGDPTTATVLDAQGQPLLVVTAYVEALGEGGATYFVPPAQPGWHSVQVAGAAPHAYGAPITVAPFTP